MAVAGQAALQRRAQNTLDEDEESNATLRRTPLNTPQNQAAMARGNVVYSGGVSAPNNQATNNFQTNPVAFGAGQSGQFNPQTMGRNFDFDAAFESGRNQLNQQLAQIGASRESLLRRLGEDFTQAQGNIDRSRDRVLDQNTVNMADRGILRSGANIQEQADIGEEYSRAVDMMGRDRARMEEDVEGQYASSYQQLSNMMEQLERDRAAAQERRDEMRAQEAAERKAAEEAAKQREQEEARLKKEAEERRAAQARQEELLRQAAQRPQPSRSGSYSIGGGGGGGVSAPRPSQPPQQPINERLLDQISRIQDFNVERDGSVTITHRGDFSNSELIHLQKALGNREVNFEQALVRRATGGGGGNVSRVR